MADDFEIPTSPEDAILQAGKGQNDTVDSIIDYSSKAMEGAAVFGGEEAAATLLGGTAAEVGAMGAGAAAAGGATIGAAVLGAGAAGVGVGMLIEKETGVGAATGDAAFNATSEETHQASLQHWESAEQNWDQGNYGSAVVDGAESVGTIVGGLAESAWDSITGSNDS